MYSDGVPISTLTQKKKKKRSAYHHQCPIEPPLSRETAKDQLFLAALRSGITGGDLLDVELYTYTRRTSSGVDMPRPVYANEAALKQASDYFVTMFEWKFREGRESTDDYDYMSDSDMEDAEDPGPGTVQSIATYVKGKDGVSDSGDGLDGVMPNKNELGTGGTVIPGPSEIDGQVETPESPFRVLDSVAYRTLQSFVFWSLTGQTSFAPLRSQSSSVHLQHNLKVAEPYDPPLCSPKSMYRFAHMCSVPELKKRALEDLISKLTPENILPELFSSLTSRYPEVQEAEIYALVNHIGLTSAVLGELPLWMSKLASKELGPRSADVMAALVQKIAKR
ncbi:hypothetical protein C8Q72DRAFT_384723 [Fomitopsis betulina]|nr:hypothetical protein C8Q72DRAFT_384723 [Fomitopsis betulina]